jgi:hypothetical protein
MKKVVCKDGKERIYLNVAVIERKEPSQFGHTHFITCAPNRKSAKRGHNIFLEISRNIGLFRAVQRRNKLRKLRDYPRKMICHSKILCNTTYPTHSTKNSSKYDATIYSQRAVLWN